MGRRAFFRIGLAVSLVWLVFNLFPLWWVIVTAFKPPLAVSQGATYIPFVDFQPTLQAFREALSGVRGDFGGPIASSVIISTAATALSVFLGAMAAYALVRFRFQIRLLAGLSFAVLSIGGFVLLNQYAGLRVPYALGIVLVTALPIAVWLNGRLPGPILKNDDVTFWEAGALASKGIKDVAELVASSMVKAETAAEPTE